MWTVASLDYAEAFFFINHLNATVQMKELNLFPVSSNELVKVENNQVVTSSLKIAEYFGKNHRDVLKAIRYLLTEKDVRKIAQMFVESVFPDKYGRMQPMFIMNKDGFILLAMGFTGRKALDFKIAYIEAFNRMEELLRTSKESKYAETIFKKQIEEFNKGIQRSIKSGRKKHGEFYGGAGDMIPCIPYYDSMSFESNLRNAFAFVNNSYLESMYFISQMFKKEKELESIKRIISKFTHEIVNKTGIY